MVTESETGLAASTARGVSEFAGFLPGAGSPCNAFYESGGRNQSPDTDALTVNAEPVPGMAYRIALAHAKPNGGAFFAPAETSW